MTNQKDFIRQASLFTMSGLGDPRLMPDYKREPVAKKHINAKATPSSSLFERLMGKLFNRRLAG